MSAERLREAAALMRSRAGQATPGPWVATVRGVMAEGDPRLWPGSARLPVAPFGGDMQPDMPNRLHIASWHPSVALAVADWLDATAASCRLMSSPPERTYFPHALAVADAYLGTPDP